MKYAVTEDNIEIFILFWIITLVLLNGDSRQKYGHNGISLKIYFYPEFTKFIFYSGSVTNFALLFLTLHMDVIHPSPCLGNKPHLPIWM